MILLVGATGFLGSVIASRLRASNHEVRALVRPTANPERLEALRASGVTTVTGDLKDPASLTRALQGVRFVISTASATVSRQEGDSIETVDLRGQLELLEAARLAEVEHFVFVSFFPQPIDFPLQTAKRAVEKALIGGEIPYTIFQPVDFTEVWLGPAVGFDPPSGSVQIFGDGTARTSWISVGDVAAFVAGAVGNPATHNRVFPLGGAPLSHLEVLGIFAELGATVTELKKIPESDLKAQYDSAKKDPLQRSIAALMLTTARGLVASPAEVLDVLPLKLKTVRDYAAEIMATRPQNGSLQ